jgi:hypothetical protein
VRGGVVVSNKKEISYRMRKLMNLKPIRKKEKKDNYFGQRIKEGLGGDRGT